MKPTDRHPETSRPGLGWRGWSRVLHRDLGYLAAGLTLVYALSGLAVNHRADWNPSRSLARRVLNLGPLDPSRPEAELAAEAYARLAIKAPFRASFQPDAETLQLFMAGWTCSIDLPTGKAVLEGIRPRPVLAAFNQMHLNETKGLWTWIADAYAVSLILLALTGLFILRGRQGLGGRGKWLAAAGAVVPLAFWAWRHLGA